MEPPWSFKWEVVGDKGSKDTYFFVYFDLACEIYLRELSHTYLHYIFGPNLAGYRHLHCLYNFWSLFMCEHMPK